MSTNRICLYGEIRSIFLLLVETFAFDLPFLELQASVARLDDRPTCDQEVAGTTIAGSATFFRGDIDHEIFSTVILSLPLIQEGQLSVPGDIMCTLLVNCLED